MKIKLFDTEYAGYYTDMVEQIKKDHLAGKHVSAMEYADDFGYLMLRFFDKDIGTDTNNFEEKCEELIKGLLTTGIAKRVE